MASHSFDARNVLGSHDRGFALVSGKHDTPQVHDTIPHGDIDEIMAESAASRRFGTNP